MAISIKKRLAVISVIVGVAGCSANWGPELGNDSSALASPGHSADQFSDLQTKGVGSTGTRADNASSAKVSDKQREIASRQSRGGRAILRAPVLPKQVSLVGLNVQAIEAMFGRPTLQRRERPAQYWRYSYAGCSVDMYFYSDVADGLVLKHIEFRAEAIDRRNVKQAGYGNDPVQSERCHNLGKKLAPSQGWTKADMRSH